MSEAPPVVESAGGRSHRTIAADGDGPPPSRMSLAHLVKDVGGVALYEGAPKVVKRLSRRRLVRLAERLGDLVRVATPTDVELMRDELTKTLGTDTVLPADEVIRRAFHLRMLNELEVLRYPSLGPHNISGTAIVEGKHRLDAALAEGRGAIVMIGHFGANQMIMPALGYTGYPMNQISAPPTAWLDIRADGRVNPLFRRVQEKRWGLEQALPTQHIDVFGFMRPAYQCLDRGEILGLACDGGGGSRWVPMPLGRRTAWVPTQPWQLARSTRAPVLSCVVLHTGRQVVHRVILAEPFVVEKTRDKIADVGRAAERFGRWLSGWIRQYPHHYLPYLLLRRKVADTDARPFFDDYPSD